MEASGDKRYCLIRGKNEYLCSYRARRQCLKYFFIVLSLQGLSSMGFVRNGSYYTIVKGPSWKEAEAKSVQLGGHLATIGDASENKFLVESFPNQPAWYMYWVGLNDAESEGVYSWSSGEPVTYYNWRPTSGPNRSVSDKSSIGPSYIEFQVNDLNESKSKSILNPFQTAY